MVILTLPPQCSVPLLDCPTEQQALMWLNKAHRDRTVKTKKESRTLEHKETIEKWLGSLEIQIKDIQFFAILCRNHKVNFLCNRLIGHFGPFANNRTDLVRSEIQVSEPYSQISLFKLTAKNLRAKCVTHLHILMASLCASLYFVPNPVLLSSLALVLIYDKLSYFVYL